LQPSRGNCSRVGAQAAQATTAQLRRTAGSVASAVFQVCRSQWPPHVRTHGGPNYSLKSDRCGVVCGTILRSRPQRPLSLSVRPYRMARTKAQRLEAAATRLVLSSFLIVLVALAWFHFAGPCTRVGVWLLLSAPAIVLLACGALLSRALVVRSPDSVLFLIEVAAIFAVVFLFCYFFATRQCSPV
jgi:hypothetical protein